MKRRETPELIRVRFDVQVELTVSVANPELEWGIIVQMGFGHVGIHRLETQECCGADDRCDPGGAAAVVVASSVGHTCNWFGICVDFDTMRQRRLDSLCAMDTRGRDTLKYDENERFFFILCHHTSSREGSRSPTTVSVSLHSLASSGSACNHSRIHRIRWFWM